MQEEKKIKLSSSGRTRKQKQKNDVYGLYNIHFFLSLMEKSKDKCSESV